MSSYTWTNLGLVSTSPGFYAWYARNYLSERDIADLVRAVSLHNSEGNHDEAESKVADFLLDSLLGPFARYNYTATLTGPLLPRYEGQLQHSQQLSPGLVQRLAQEPERLNVLINALDKSVPVFASPLYIGMAENLKERIAGHKSLIIRFRARHDPLESVNHTPNERSADNSFAAEVVRRKLTSSQLVLFTHELPESRDSAVDLENLLNRINFPICGRN